MNKPQAHDNVRVNDENARVGVGNLTVNRLSSTLVSVFVCWNSSNVCTKSNGF